MERLKVELDSFVTKVRARAVVKVEEEKAEAAEEVEASRVGSASECSCHIRVCSLFCFIFVVLLRYCDCSCYIRVCSLHSAHTNLTINTTFRVCSLHSAHTNLTINTTLHTSLLRTRVRKRMTCPSVLVDYTPVM
jgi:hypothetical protein